MAAVERHTEFALLLQSCNLGAMVLNAGEVALAASPEKRRCLMPACVRLSEKFESFSAFDADWINAPATLAPSRISAELNWRAIGIGGRALAADFAEKDPERDFL
jgi:hypothetical protein